MSDLWQHLLVAAIVLAAGGWLWRRHLRRRAKAAACDSCALHQVARQPTGEGR